MIDSKTRHSAQMTGSNLRAALDKFRSLLGEEFVIVDDQGLVKYRDKHAPDYETDGEFFPSAAIRPKTVEQIQEILKIANNHGVPLQYFSRGRNFGYGGPNAV